MRRGGWLLTALLTLSIAGIGWWTTRNTLRIEPFDANRFAQMSQSEQVEWLVKQSLARSRASRLISEWWARWFPSQRDMRTPLSGMQIRMLAEACMKHDLPHLLNRLAPYGENEKARELARLYRALWHAQEGNPQRAIGEIESIRVRELRALALAQMGAVHQQAGETELARQRFDAALRLLKQSALPTHPEIYIETLRTLVEQTPLRESPEQVADLVRGLSVPYHTIAAQQLGRLYLKMNEAQRLPAFAKALPPKARNALKPCLAIALIQQGKAQAGYELALRTPYQEAWLVDAEILRALHKAGETPLAEQLFVRRLATSIVMTDLQQMASSRLGGRRLDPNDNLYIWMMTQASCEAGLQEEVSQLLLRTSSREARVLAFLEFAAARYRAGDEDGARHYVDLAIAEFQQTGSDIPLLHPISSLHDAGARSLSSRFLKQAREHALQVKVPWLRSGHLSRIALAYAYNGEYEEAVRTALMLPELEQQRDELIRIARVLAEMSAP